MKEINTSAESYGTKADNLIRLKENGFNVPDFFCVTEKTKEQEILSSARSLRGELFSVRSSAQCEDGRKNSFAGQFMTYLNVPPNEIYEKVQQCLSHTARAYSRAFGINPRGRICAVVQKMVEPELSGVIFTANPDGRLNETVIVTGRGAGENVVSGRCAVTHFYINRSDDSRWYEMQEGAPLPDSSLIDRLYMLSQDIEKLFGFSCDIEFAVRDDEIFILQARYITTLDYDKKIVLDSSNICESYPGVSLPLTQDFVKKVYYGVFKSVVKRLMRGKKVTARLDDTLRKMTDTADGRIYYRISGWYDVINLLPFSGKIIPVWQDMLGVEDRTVTSGFSAGVLTKAVVFTQFVNLIFSNNRRMKRLDTFFKSRISDYRRRTYDTCGVKNLIGLYENIRDEICSVWDITLVNDMYTFIFTGLLKSYLKRKYPDSSEERLTELIYADGDLESMKPVKALEKLREQAEKLGIVGTLGKIKTASDYRDFCSSCDDDFGKLMDEYILLYGDRAPCELKLETRTPRTNPEMLAAMIAAGGRGVSDRNIKKHIVPSGLIEKILAKRAVRGTAQREKSRLDRTRLYGLMREIILKAADELCKSGKLMCRDDIFYLSTQEILSLEAGEDYSSEIMRRKRLYELYERMPSPRRIVFAGKVTSVYPSGVNCTAEISSNTEFSGIACSKGIVCAEIIKVLSPESVSPEKVKGRIILARMTDPGWVTLICESAGLICERGSLLSHTAIISRELKKPAAVGISGIFDALSDGQKVLLNGDEGRVILKEG
ncbi:MAG: PEP/pyruvate-binding domain-containing protein [Porcipelethomonas sp.]